ncbi:MAG TPA: NUDIX hydrolase [Pseudomonadales bacterium]|nr:NUDIX hydrolase [Pseudomonadales bacterium]
MDWPPHITVAAIAEREGKFLFVEEDVGFGPVLNQPAGHLDPGETLFEAVVRETLEETGWQVEPRGVIGIYHYASPEAGIVYHRIAFQVQPLRQTDGALDSPIRAVHWLTPDELPRFALRSPLVTLCIEDFLRRGSLPLAFIAHPDATGTVHSR